MPLNKSIGGKGGGKSRSTGDLRVEGDEKNQQSENRRNSEKNVHFSQSASQPPPPTPTTQEENPEEEPKDTDMMSSSSRKSTPEKKGSTGNLNAPSKGKPASKSLSDSTQTDFQAKTRYEALAPDEANPLLDIAINIGAKKREKSFSKGRVPDKTVMPRSSTPGPAKKSSTVPKKSVGQLSAVPKLSLKPGVKKSPAHSRQSVAPVKESPAPAPPPPPVIKPRASMVKPPPVPKPPPPVTIVAEPSVVPPPVVIQPPVPIIKKPPKPVSPPKIEVVESQTDVSDAESIPISEMSLQSSVSETHSETTFSSAVSTADEVHMEVAPRKSHKPRPSHPHLFDFDDDDEMWSDMSKPKRRGASNRLGFDLFNETSLSHAHPDDELLFSLTKKEEYIFRKNMADMRWEVEESIVEDETEEELEAAGKRLWQRVGAPPMKIPLIYVNDRRISLSHLDADEDQLVRELGADNEDKDASYQNIFEEDGAADSTDSDPVQTIFDLIDESARKRAAAAAHGPDKRELLKVKLWRRRLVVVILLNFVMRFRNKFKTFCEVVVPVIVSSILILGMIHNSEFTMQAWQEEHQGREAKNYDPFAKITTDAMLSAYCSNDEYCDLQKNRHYYIVYSPRSIFTERLMLRALQFLGYNKNAETTSKLSQLIGVENSSEVQRYCNDHWHGVDSHLVTDTSNLDLTSEQKRKAIRNPIGIVFSYDNGLTENKKRTLVDMDSEVPKVLVITIRTYYTQLSNTVERFPFRERRSRLEGKPSQTSPYLLTGVLGLQTALDLAFAEKLLNKSLADGDTHMQIKKGNDETLISRKSFFERFIREPSLKRFEYPSFKDMKERVRGWVAFTVIIVLSYVVCDICVAQEIVAEQNRGSIEMLKIHGMTTGMRWFAYLIITGVLRAITASALAILIHIEIASYAVAKHNHPFFLWSFLWLHGCAVTCFNYFITTGCGIKKAELAGLVVVLFNFGSLLAPTYIFISGNLDRFTNMILCFLFPQWNLANGMYYYLRYEIYEEGFEWYDFPVLMDTKNHRIMSILFCCNLYIYSIMFYMGLTIYMDHILPREFSPKESWLYFLQPYFRKSPSETTSTRPIPKNEKPAVYEPGPALGENGPRLRNITLTETNKATDLDNISLDFYEGEVTCIVGQIGSGKSDLLNCMAGVRVPSAGFVDVKGMKVHEYHDITNRYVSLCPQKQLLLEYLSVEDHIRLCCMLHGASYGKAKLQATFLLKMFELMPMRRHNYKGLTTSDMKKLLVAMALSKSPSVLLLDNPIDQLDAEARFEFWKLLQELKPQRSIIVTCTNLEDAMLYADRIAVLSKGKLVCYGTPAFIKLAYGIGTVVTLRKSEKSVTDTGAIKKLIDRELRGVKCTLLETKGASIEGDSVKFILPYGKFCGGVLEKLEANMGRFNITKIITSQPSLWALFHKIASHKGVEAVLASREIRHLKGTAFTENSTFETALNSQIPTLSETPKRNVISVFTILVIKKIWYYRQKYWTFLIGYFPQILMFIQVLYFVSLLVPFQPEGVAKEISIGVHENNYILFRSADNEHTRAGWEEAFMYVLHEDDHSTVVETLGYEDDIEAYLATGTSHSLNHYKMQANIAFSRDTSGLVGYFSSNSLHSSAIAAHVLMQVFIYMLSPNTSDPHRTVIVSHPFPQFETYPSSSSQSNAITIIGVLLSLVLALLVVPSLRMISTEKLTMFKAAQRMCGVSSTIYWFTHGIADIILYVLLCPLCVAIMVFLDSISYKVLTEPDERLCLLVIFASWLCWAAIPYTYFVGIVMPGRITGYVHYLVMHFFLGIVPKIVTYQFMRTSVTGFANVVRYLLYIFPPYSITSASIHFVQIMDGVKWCKHYDSKLCDKYKNITEVVRKGKTNQPDYIRALSETPQMLDEINVDLAFSTCCLPFCSMSGTCFEPRKFFTDTSHHSVIIPGIREDVVALVFNGFFYWTLLILIEKQIIQSVYSFIATKLCGNLEKSVAQSDIKVSEEPEDVKEEHMKVDFMVDVEGDVDSEVYLVQDVTKFYLYTKGLDHVCFSVPINSITGILGLPKSGKSTMLHVLTGQLTPSAGYVYKDNDLMDGKSRKSLLLNVGFCPQRPAVLPYLTASQMLTVMGRLRGLSSSECYQHVTSWLRLFGLEDVASRKCSTLNTGQSRRVGTAMALIGGTKMVIFDEPTAFLDNLEKYIFWNVVSRLPSKKTTVLFASCDASEVQNQSSKILVLDAGSIVAVGNLDDIFTNNQGMLLAIRYGTAAAISKKYTEFQRKTKIDKLKDHVVQYLSPCSLLDEQSSLLIYHLKDQTLKLSRIYTIMEGAKVKFASILDLFQVFEPSLDDIILQLHKSKNKQ